MSETTDTKPACAGSGVSSEGGKPNARLTGKQARFVEEFLACGNQTEAARRAGYRNPHVAGCTVAKHRDVAAEIARRRAETLSAAVLTKQRAEELLSAQAVDTKLSPKDRREAMRLLGRFGGWEAPTRTQLSGVDGGPIQHELTALPLTALIELLGKTDA